MGCRGTISTFFPSSSMTVHVTFPSSFGSSTSVNATSTEGPASLLFST